MVSILIKQKLLISEVLDALEYQSSQEKRPLKPLNKLSLYIAGMLFSHQCDTTPQAQTNTLSGTTTVGEFQNVKGNTLSHQLQANNKMILFLWNISNPSYDTKSWVTS